MTSETMAGKLPDPVAVLYPDSGFRQDDHAIALWHAHQYDTGGEPFYSADQLHSYAAERVALCRIDGEVLLEHSGCGYGTECNQIDVKLDRGDRVVLVKRNNKADSETHECVCQDEAVAECTPYGTDCLYGKPEALAASEPVEAVAFCRVEDAFDNDSILAQMGAKRGDKLYLHPAPEQPGKGEEWRADVLDRLREHAKRLGFDSIADVLDHVELQALSAPQPSDPAEGESLARRFHETYERLAPQFGYETRTETRNFDPSSPNGRLMIAVCTELAALSTPTTAAVSVNDAMVRRFVEAANPVVYLLPPPDVIRLALTAALDPQVKR